jgi:hypothetical protein
MSSKKSIGEPATERNSNQARKKKVELDLPEILEGELRKESENECRTLEQHIIYILKNRHRVSCETLTVRSIPCENDLVYRGYPRNWDGSPSVTC